MERVSYTGMATPLGTVWAAATKAGILQIDFPRPEAEFLGSIKKRVAETDFVRDGGGLDELRRMMEEYFRGGRSAFDLPLDLRGSEFQRAVWLAMSRIPHGRLSTYRRLAAEVGRPRAVRAVGNAVGDNPLPIVIPCHRVVRSDGGLGGFGGGLGLKVYLLRLEGVLAGAPSDGPSASGVDEPGIRRFLLRRLE